MMIRFYDENKLHFISTDYKKYMAVEFNIIKYFKSDCVRTSSDHTKICVYIFVNYLLKPTVLLKRTLEGTCISDPILSSSFAELVSLIDIAY